MTGLNNYLIPRIVISGLRGGSGKTILSLCLIAAWRKKGLIITPFKKGPDYIDSGWLAKIAGAPCYNLDLFMMTPEQALQSFVLHTSEKISPSPFPSPARGEGYLIPPPLTEGGGGEVESPSCTYIALIEGNRGLYDGVDHKGTYSTAELAKLLKSPVILIVDSAKATHTISAMILGCQKMDPGVAISGIVLNNVATGRQESLIQKSIEDTCNLPVFGAIPRLENDPFPERHMGLTPFQEHADLDKSLAAVAEIGEKYIDVDGVLKIVSEAEPLGVRGKGLGISEKNKTNLQSPTPNPLVRIGIIRDSAFQFYYPDNFEELEKRGAQLIEINALRETKLPDIDALYIGGGFPETHAVALADNISFKNSLREAIERGLPVYAECGGLMYLGENLILDNKTYPMVGVLSIVFDLKKKPQAHGYTIVEVEKPNPYFKQNIILKGHEFHYSRVLEIKENGAYMAFNVKRGRGVKDEKDGLCYKNVLATYTHLHAIGAPEWTDGLIKCAKKFKEKK